MFLKLANSDTENGFLKKNQKCPLKNSHMYSGNWKLEKTSFKIQDNTATGVDLKKISISGSGFLII